MTRHLACPLLLALTLPGAGTHGTSPRHPAVPSRATRPAPALRTYTDHAHGYALRYPRAWTLQTGVERGGVDAGLDALSPVVLVLGSPRTNTGLVAVAGPGVYSPARIRQVETRALLSGGDPGDTQDGPLTFGHRLIGGVVFQEARATFTTRTGTIDGDALMATRRTLTYLFVVVTPRGPRTAAERAQMGAVVTSITFRP